MLTEILAIKSFPATRISDVLRGRVRRGKEGNRTEEEEEKRRRRRREKKMGVTRVSCSARGNPPPTLYWTMNGQTIKNAYTSQIITKK